MSALKLAGKIFRLYIIIVGVRSHREMFALDKDIGGASQGTSMA